jgi:TonB family protein
MAPPCCRLLAAVLFFPAVARAQAIGGIVRGADGQPLWGVGVFVPGDSGKPLARHDTQRDGTFILALPRPGRYQLRFAVASNALLVGDSITVEGDDFVQREFRLIVPPDPVYWEHQVEKPAVPAPGNKGPRYPLELKQAGIQGGIVAEFVIDTTGRVRRDTFRVIRATHAGFVVPVRTALEEMRFLPAERAGRRVAQLAVQPFLFELTF